MSWPSCSTGGHSKYLATPHLPDSLDLNSLTLDSLAFYPVALDSLALDSVALDSLAFYPVGLDSLALDSLVV